MGLPASRQWTEADIASVEQCLREAAEARKPFPLSRMLELESFLIALARRQESDGGSMGDDAALEAARSHFSEHIITRALVRDTRRNADCLGKPGKKPIHAAK
jgi:hypothetical protein